MNDKIKAAEEILSLSVNLFYSQYGYFAYALEKLSPKIDEGVKTAATDGVTIRINPLYFLEWTAEGKSPVSLLLHILLHVLFLHPFKRDVGIDYSLAADICVCSAVDEIGSAYDSDKNRNERKAVYKSIISQFGIFNEGYAEKYLANLGEEEKDRLKSIFHVCDHSLWHSDVKPLGGERDLEKIIATWRKIAVEAMRASDLSSGTFSSIVKANAGGKYDYRNFLRKFLNSEEVIKSSDEEFDLIYYRLGLDLYGNVPLIENLEYREDKNLSDVVIAIDTSGSTRGEPVKRFLEETYSLISGNVGSGESFGVRIIQCDSEIKSDKTVYSKREFEDLMANFTLVGGGGTDFRPVFKLLEKDKKDGRKIKGLIYFADGEGTFPKEDAGIKTCFALYGANADKVKTPYFAYRIELGGI